MTQKKYTLSAHPSHYHDGRRIYRIQALRSFGDVEEGDWGGFVESESNLSHFGNCWIYDDAIAMGNSIVTGDAKMIDNAVIKGSSVIMDEVTLSGSVVLPGNSIIRGNTVMFSTPLEAGGRTGRELFKSFNENCAKYNSLQDLLDTKQIIYGFKIDSNEDSPFAKVTYLEDAVGKTPAKMNYSTGVFEWGDWSPNEFFMPRPCMVKYDGTVDYYLDPDDYTKKEDGTQSDVANTSYDGNAMMEWGRNGYKIWMKVVPDSTGNGASIFISNKQVDSDYIAYPFYNANGELKDHFYTAIYNGSYDGARLRSISGQATMVSQDVATEVSRAQANNPSGKTMWYTDVIADRMLINMLLILMGKSTDTQTVFGQGTGNSGVVNSGSMDKNGLFYGTSSGKVKVFGMEYWWGNILRRIAGYVAVDGIQYMKFTWGIQDGSSRTGYCTDGSSTGYINMGVSGLTSSGYINLMKFSKYGMVPSAYSGSETTHYTEYYYGASGTRYAYVGGYYGDGTYAGAFSVNLDYYATNTNPRLGTALSLKPA